MMLLWRSARSSIASPDEFVIGAPCRTAAGPRPKVGWFCLCTRSRCGWICAAIRRFAISSRARDTTPRRWPTRKFRLKKWSKRCNPSAPRPQSAVQVVLAAGRISAAMEMGRLARDLLEVETGTASSIGLSCWRRLTGVKGRLEYNTDLFEAGDRSFLQPFQSLLHRNCRRARPPHPGTADDAGGTERLLADINQTRPITNATPAFTSVPGTGERTPDAVAMVLARNNGPTTN